MKQEMMGWKWHQMDHMQSFAPHCRQITTTVPHQSVITGRMPLLPPNQQRRIDYSCIELYYYILFIIHLPSVLSCCWLEGRKGIQPVKMWVVGCWHGYLSADLYMAQLMTLLLNISCSSKSRLVFTFLVLAHPVVLVVLFIIHVTFIAA